MIPAKIQIRNSEMAKSLHPDLQRILREMSAANMDYQLSTTYRGKADQEKAKRDGHSNAHFGQSPHNYLPARAFDALPYPVDWNNANRFIEQHDKIMAIAQRLGIKLTWGGDWKSIKDMPHFELTGWRSIPGNPQ